MNRNVRIYKKEVHQFVIICYVLEVQASAYNGMYHRLEGYDTYTRMPKFYETAI